MLCLKLGYSTRVSPQISRDRYILYDIALIQDNQFKIALPHDKLGPQRIDQCVTHNIIPRYEFEK